MFGIRRGCFAAFTLWTVIYFVLKGNSLEEFRKTSKVHTTLFCCTIYIVLVCLTCMSSLLLFATEYTLEPYEKFDVKRNKTVIYRQSKLDLNVPFDTSVSDGHHLFVFLFEILNIYARTMSFLPIDVLLCGTLIHLISQTVVVQEAIKKIPQGIAYDENTENMLLLHKIRIVKCINEIQEIYRAMEKVEELFSIQFLITYTLAEILLCTLLYSITLVQDMKEVLSLTIMITACLGEIFMYTFYGQTLTLELQKIATNVFDLDWINYPPALRKDLVFLIKRVQNPFHITVGKLFHLDLTFFMGVLQKSYSFYTLITNRRN